MLKIAILHGVTVQGELAFQISGSRDEKKKNG